MEYANLHSQQHQLEESASSLQPITPSTVVSSSGDYTWSQSIRILNNNGSDNLYSSETNPNSRFFPSQASNFMTSEDLTYSFDEARNLMNRQSNSGAKEEASDSFSKLRINLPFEVNKSNLLSSLGLANSHPPYSASDPFYFSSSSAQENSSNFGPGFASFGHVYPNNINYSPSTRSSSSIGLNSSQVLDLLSPPRPNYRSAQSCSPSSQNSSSLGLYRECNMSLGHGDNNQEYSRSSLSSTSNMKSGFFSEVTATRTKRRSPSILSEPNKDQSHKNVEAKKSKSILRTPNPPLKVRKEKLGDRISALHRLVAPFGKTDTASVLTEAIGYIHFLHDQVQTLSIPFLKSLQGKLSRKTHQVHGFGKDAETEVKILDLRSRGLCLVPVSCASYINNGFE